MASQQPLKRRHLVKKSRSTDDSMSDIIPDSITCTDDQYDPIAWENGCLNRKLSVEREETNRLTKELAVERERASQLTKELATEREKTSQLIESNDRLKAKNIQLEENWIAPLLFWGAVWIFWSIYHLLQWFVCLIFSGIIGWVIGLIRALFTTIFTISIVAITVYLAILWNPETLQIFPLCLNTQIVNLCIDPTTWF